LAAPVSTPVSREKQDWTLRKNGITSVSYCRVHRQPRFRPSRSRRSSRQPFTVLGFLSGETRLLFAKLRDLSFGRAEANQLFFTRRIGLTESGAPVPIDYGAKITGKAGQYNVGFLHVQTRSLGDSVSPFHVPRGQFTIARVKTRHLRAFKHRRHLRKSSGCCLSARNRLQSWGWDRCRIQSV